MATKRKKSRRVQQPGVGVRVFKRRDTYWLDVRLDSGRRIRKSAQTADKSEADARALALAQEIAMQRGQPVTKTDTVTLAEIFRLYHESYRDDRGRAPEGQWKQAANTRTAAFLAAWGTATPVVSISQTSVGKYCDARQQAFKAKRDDPAALLRDGAFDCDFRWLSSVFNWGARHKLADGSRLLSHNPLRDCKWPREDNPRRAIASQERFLATMQHVDRVDPVGRLRAMLSLARHTARREDAICRLRASDVLLSRERIISALAAGGQDVTKADSMPYGAIRWAAETDKQDTLHIAPISPESRAAVESYLAANPRVGDVPLFPSVRDPDRSITRHTAIKWLVRAETLAQQPKLAGSVWHAYRRLWATERQNVADVAVAAGGGWKSTKTLKLYQQARPEDVLAAVLNASPLAPMPTPEGTAKAHAM